MLSSALCFLLLTASFWVSSSALSSYEEPNFGAIETRTWPNNASITDTIMYNDGSLARLILKTEGNDSIPLPPFGCGFICPGNNDTWFFAVVFLGGLNASLADQPVWLANREKPIRGNGTLEFTAEGGLVLRDSDGTDVWSSRTSGKSLVGIELGEEGSLRLYNDNYTVWESFDEPSDTLLPGQMLRKDAQLVASGSAKNWSRGQYYIQMTSDGFTAFVQSYAPLTYFQLGVPKAGSNTELYRRRDSEALSKERMVEKAISIAPASLTKASGGATYKTGPGLLADRPARGKAAGKTYTEPCTYQNRCDRGSVIYPGPPPTTNTELNRRRDPGVLPRPSTYAALEGENLILVIGATKYSYRVSHDAAAASYRYLRLGFDGDLSIYEWQKENFSKRVYDLVANDCQNPSDMVDSNLSYSFNDSDAAGNLTDLKKCKQTCQDSCDCQAAFFKYGSNASDGDCYLLSEISSITGGPIPGDKRPYNFSAFRKVQLPDSESPAPTPQTYSPPHGSPQTYSPPHKRTNLVAILSGSLAAVLIALLLSAFCIIISRRKSKEKKKEEREIEGEYNFNPVLRMPRRFSYDQMRVATEDFKDRLGGGGFGTVFGGVLEDSTRIAVKRLDNRGQGMKQFLAEVETIGNVHHFNLVRLIGFCADRSCQLLVYEYMSNRSLDTWIFDSQRNQDIDWQTRKKIILGIAKGLAYLHEECFRRIVHLDIKPQNILLDDNFNAKISDFGLSKLMDRDQSQVQTTMRGTPGYLAPEWLQLRITLKVDIYSFGIVVLEIICGRKNLESSRPESSGILLRLLQEKAEVDSLLDFAEGSSIDMHLHGDEVLKMIKLAIWCLQDDHTRRPLMSVVVKVLEGAMEVDPNISHRFCNAMAHAPAAAYKSDPPKASVLSAP